MVQYLSLCLQHRAAPGRPVSTELVRGRAAGLAAALQSAELAPAVQNFLTLTTRLLRASVTDAPLFCLLETVAAAPRTLAPLLAGELHWIRVRPAGSPGTGSAGSLSFLCIADMNCQE